jgi:hypothetical protein
MSIQIFEITYNIAGRHYERLVLRITPNPGLIVILGWDLEMNAKIIEQK